MASLGLAFVGTMTMGGWCDPPPPQDNDCKPIECDDGQIVVCQNKCVTPVPVGGTCSLTDLCADDGTCADDATCVATPGVPVGKGTCQHLGRGWLAECSSVDWTFPGQPSTECASGLYCKSGQCPGWNVNRCVKPHKFGDYCDNSVIGQDITPCYECEPGLECVGTGASEGSGSGNVFAKPGMCLKRCEVDRECPCDSKCDTEGPELRYFCKPCRSLHDKCDSTHTCCDDDTRCVEGTCCKQRGTSCENKADCCGTDRCVEVEPGHSECRMCQAYGKECRTDNECCGGGDCREGVCSPTCHEGAPCTVPHKKGPCAKGKWRCYPGGRECEQVVFPADEVCDGKDNDCDGYIDKDAQGVGDECANPTNVHCQGGFEVKGHKVCKNKHLRCEAKEGTDYCNHCGGDCGACEGQPCGTTNLCVPNVVCSGSAGQPQICRPEQPWCNPNSPPLCWHKEDVGKCLGTLVGGSGGSAQ